MNVLIFPTDDRSGQASLIYHYSKLGHRVLVPKHGTFGLNWKRIATWPALLYKSTQDPTKRNIEIHGFERTEENLFGEDRFLTNELSSELYPDDVTCELIDESFDEPVDVFHTLRGGESWLTRYFEIIDSKFPGAKWVSSTFNQHTSTPCDIEVKNAAKLIPAPYEGDHLSINNVSLMSTDFEARLLGVKLDSLKLLGPIPFGSFNHNFIVRQPVDWKLFCSMNRLLEKHGLQAVPNYGGNIRTQGADTHYSKGKGLTGWFKTLTPPDAYKLTSELRAAVHFKADDWGGGVFYYSLNTHTPIVTTQRYIDASNSGKFLINDKNCMVVNTPEEASKAVMALLTNDALVTRLSDGMREMKEQVFGPDYWTQWERFLEALV